MIKWTPSFNGGDSQTFVALAFRFQQEDSRSAPIADSGIHKEYETQLLNLQPSTKYTFYVLAQNKHGNASSEKVQCETLKDINDQTAVVAGSVGGTLALGILMFITVFLLHRRYTCICTIGFEKRNRNTYDELSNPGNVNQYEAVLMKEQEENTRMYEKLRHTNDNKNENHEVARTSC
uniref:Uncharacterized protein LOC111122977 isoform X2 n=1 Tax=Crassostrea virginica TaxID=6565 RepID=A0A8B8CXY9_CRAVI|nr:uncharacterized protein LOC111122977 isoform X2 [Crassostrea virginica]